METPTEDSQRAITDIARPSTASTPPAHATGHHSATSKVASGSQSPGSHEPSKLMQWLLVVGAAVVALVIITLILAIAIDNKDKSDKVVVTSNSALNTSEYQALFLTNGQVYFGKLSNLDGKFVSLTDIYYLQVQSSTSADVQPASKSTDQSQVSLAKLGSELHGPEDKMNVASDQVLFWENLKPGSKVVKAITDYQVKK